MSLTSDCYIELLSDYFHPFKDSMYPVDYSSEIRNHVIRPKLSSLSIYGMGGEIYLYDPALRHIRQLYAAYIPINIHIDV